MYSALAVLNELVSSGQLRLSDYYNLEFYSSDNGYVVKVMTKYSIEMVRDLLSKFPNAKHSIDKAGFTQGWHRIKTTELEIILSK